MDEKEKDEIIEILNKTVEIQKHTINEQQLAIDLLKRTLKDSTSMIDLLTETLKSITED